MNRSVLLFLHWLGITVIIAIIGIIGELRHWNGYAYGLPALTIGVPYLVIVTRKFRDTTEYNPDGTPKTTDSGGPKK